MNQHWAIKYVGMPWARGASGPDAYDCWGLVRAVHLELFNNALPAIEPEEGKYALAQLLAAFKDSGELQTSWVPVDKPQLGDALVMCRTRDPMHVGVFCEEDGGSVLHSIQPSISSRTGGVFFQKVRTLSTSGWGHIFFVRHRSLITC